MGNLTHSPVNDHRLADFMKEVGKLGATEGDGSTARARLFVDAVRAAQDGVIGTDPHPDKSDDAGRVYAAYAAARAKSAPSEQNKDSIKTKTSDLRQGVNAAVMPNIDHSDNVERTYRFRAEAIKAGAKVKSAWQAFADVSREQLRNPGRQLGDDEIKALIPPKAAKDKELEDILKKITGDVEKLITGERKDGIKTQDPNVLQAHEFLKAAIAALLQNNADAEFFAQAAARGLVFKRLPVAVTIEA